MKRVSDSSRHTAVGWCGILVALLAVFGPCRPIVAQRTCDQASSAVTQCDGCTENAYTGAPGTTWSISATSCQVSGTCEDCCWDVRFEFQGLPNNPVLYGPGLTYLSVGSDAPIVPDGGNAVSVVQVAHCATTSSSTLCVKGHVTYFIQGSSNPVVKCLRPTCSVCSATILE